MCDKIYKMIKKVFGWIFIPVGMCIGLFAAVVLFPVVVLVTFCESRNCEEFTNDIKHTYSTWWSDYRGYFKNLI